MRTRILSITLLSSTSLFAASPSLPKYAPAPVTGAQYKAATPTQAIRVIEAPPKPVESKFPEVKIQESKPAK